jgi:cbb3-type cytochrome oxidase maturation protein
MSILYLLIPLALILLGIAVWIFFWAVGSGQFDDLDTPALRIIMDDDKKPPEDAEE